MNYFHAVSVYQLINLLLYKKKYCNEDENCIILRDILVPKLRSMSYLEEEFDRVIIYTDYWKEKSIESQEKSIVSYYDDLFEKAGLDLTDSMIIVGCAHNTFGMYLSIREFKFVFLEDAAGLLSRSYILDAINKKQYALKYELICKYGLITGENPNITKYMCDFIAQSKEFHVEASERYIDFCVVRELGELDQQERKELIELFVEMKTIPLQSNAMILLTQHFANLRTLTYEEQMLIYQIFIDYFTNGYDVVLKPHPDDLMYYPLLFPELTIIKEKFPAEFLPFMFENKPRAVATVSSTSSFSLRSCFDNVIEMGTDFETDFVKTHRYYVALKLLQKFSNNKKGFFYGCNEELIGQLAKNWTGDMKLQEYTIEQSENTNVVIMDCFKEGSIVGRRHIKNNLETHTFILLNSDMAYDFYDFKDKEIWDDTIPIVIRKTALIRTDSTRVADLDAETIYVITKDERMKKMARETRLNMELKSCGIKLEVEPLNADQERIKILEGMLAATEKRLARYIELYGENEEESDL